MRSIFITTLFLAHFFSTYCQLQWHLVDSTNKYLPTGVKLYFTNDSIAGKPNIAYYIEADLNDNNLIFDVDTTLNRRLTPNQFYLKNDKPLLVVNGTFFSFKTNQNLNTVIKNGLPVSYNTPNSKGINKDSIYQMTMHRSAIGINKKHEADVAWIANDTSSNKIYASQTPILPYLKMDIAKATKKTMRANKRFTKKHFKNWEMLTAIGGGPVLIQNQEIKITNEAELLFTGKSFEERNPRTAMGYTKDKKLIILVIQGRFANIAEGASLLQEANILKDLGCVEALNLDGGGSSCMLVNGNETIKPSDKTGQRAVPAIFMIKTISP